MMMMKFDPHLRPARAADWLPARGPEIAKESAARPEFIEESVAAETLKPAGDPNVTYRLRPSRRSASRRALGTSPDGTIFFWLDADDRPVVCCPRFIQKSTPSWLARHLSSFTSCSPRKRLESQSALSSSSRCPSGRARRHARAADGQIAKCSRI